MPAVTSSWNHHSSMFFNREMILLNGISYPCTRHEDEIFRHKCLYVSKQVTYIDKMMFMYRNNQNSETHKKQSPEMIYVPLLQSWKDLLVWHKKYHSGDREVIRFCNSVLCMYIIEAIEAFYRHGISDKVIEKIMQEEGYCEILEKYKQVVDSKRIYSHIQSYYKEHNRFILKNRIMGCWTQLLHLLLRNKWVRYAWELKKYPIRITDEGR